MCSALARRHCTLTRLFDQSQHTLSLGDRAICHVILSRDPLRFVTNYVLKLETGDWSHRMTMSMMLRAAVLVSFWAIGDAFLGSPALCPSPRLRAAPAGCSVRMSASAGGWNPFGSSQTSDAQREEAKRRLRQLVASTKQGKGASDAERMEIFAAMEAIESLNPTAEPADSKLLGGKWSLLYTGASAEDSANRRLKEGAIGSALTELAGASDAPRGLGQVLGEDENAPLPLGRRLTTLAGSAVENKGNFQDIDVASGLVENRAEFALLGLPAVVRIQGRCERVGSEAARLAVFFERVELKLAALSATVPLTWANNGKGPEGWVDTTYLDADLRCGRGDKGSFFIAARRPD
jgi:hypothetical protein